MKVGALDIDGCIASSICEVKYLKDEKTFEMLTGLVKQLQSGSTVHFRAYSLDQPQVIESLVDACGKGIRVSILADGTQAGGRTKNQMQVLKQLQNAGAKVSVVKGRSVRGAYESDNRGANIGGGLKGLHHAKSVLLGTRDGTQYLIIGSCNFTTSSKANWESGVLVKVDGPDGASSALIRDWMESFQEVSGSGSTLEEIEDKKTQRGSKG